MTAAVTCKQRVKGVILPTILLLSLTDLILTILWIEIGIAIEGNPLMAVLIDHGGYPLFAAVKLALVGAGVWVMDRFWHKDLAEWGAWISMIIYAGICGYHTHALMLV